jgi:hypothetical protein
MKLPTPQPIPMSSAQHFPVYLDYSSTTPVDITAPHINIEMIGGHIIEVHLRHNADPIMYDEFIPIWNKDQICPAGYTRISDKKQHIDRLGFFVK